MQEDCLIVGAHVEYLDILALEQHVSLWLIGATEAAVTELFCKASITACTFLSFQKSCATAAMI